MRTWAKRNCCDEKSQGWLLFVHPLLEAQLEKLVKQAEVLATWEPRRYASHPAVKLLATINYYMRKSGSKTDAYAVFRAMLESGDPPNSLAELLRTAKEMRERAR